MLDSVNSNDINSPIISLSKQILISRDSNPSLIRNFLSQQVQLALENYGRNESFGDIILKYRPITLKSDKIDKIKGLKLSESATKTNLLIRNYSKIKSPLFNGSIIPLTMDLSKYGNLLSKLFSLYYITKFDLNDNGKLYQRDGYIIYVHEYVKDDNFIQDCILFKDKIIITKFKNVSYSKSLNDFTRVFDNHKFIIQNNLIKYFDKGFVNSYIKPTKVNKKINKNIVTFDIETYQKEDKFIPYACGWFDGSIKQTYYLTDFKNHYEMLKQSLIDLIYSNPNAKVYVHNLANFDYILLTKVLFDNFEVNPLFKDNKIIKISFNLKGNKKKNTIDLFDSYLFLPSSLRVLALKYQ